MEERINRIGSEDNVADVGTGKKFTVVGAGVIGLMTALELRDRGHDVEVIAPNAHNRGGQDVTSSIAVGQFLPFVPPEHAKNLMQGNIGDLEGITDHSRGFYELLSRNPELTGVMPVTNLELVSSTSPWPGGLKEAMRAQNIDMPEGEVITLKGPEGEEVSYDELLEFPTFSINTRKTLEYLLRTAEENGIVLTEKSIRPDELADLDGVIINASGQNSQELDSSKGMVNMFKGHTFVIRPRPGQALPEYAFSVDDLIFMPREDGTIVMGALYIEDPERPIPEEEEANELFIRLGELIKKVQDLVPGLDTGLISNSDVLVHSAGYRVELKEDKGGGARISPDEEITNLLHAYGFGGIGWSVGPRIAQVISSIAEDMHPLRSLPR